MSRKKITALKNESLNPFLWWRKNLWTKLLTIALSVLIVAISGMYGIARWYIASKAREPVQFGATFIPSYARFFELDPQETMTAMVDDLGFKRLRLVSYWSIGEAVEGQYDFSELDWQFRMAEEKGVDVSLALGLRQPRWPECHMPYWAEKLPKDQWAPKLKDYMTVVVNRYKDSPALESYQLENEFFLKVFGICPDHSRDRLIDEFKLVKQLDPDTPLIVSRSNNALGWPLGEPQGDKTAVSVYKRVWDKTLTKRYFEYPFPAWYYGFLAGWNKIWNGNDTVIHELQAEAWMPDGYQINDLNDLKEQGKSMNPKRLHDRFEYGRATGMKQIDLWGVEWWYWRKVKAGDPTIWDAAREEVQKTNQLNSRL